MASLNQISTEIADALGKPFDYMLKERIKGIFKHQAATFLRRDIERNGVDSQYKRRYTLDVTQVDSADNCNVTVGCTILRTSNKIAPPVRYKGAAPFTFVGSPDGSIVYQHRTANESNIYIEELPFIGKAISYVYSNEYLYLYNATRLKYVTVEGVHTNLDALNICSGEEECYTDDFEFSIPEDMIQDIKLALLKGELGLIKTNDYVVNIDTDKDENAGS